MSPSLPAEDLECPDPDGCPVAVDSFAELVAADKLTIAEFSPDRSWFRVYDAHDGFDTPNPGYGDTRFAPFDDARGRRVPTFYLAETLEAALLESVLHDIDLTAPRVMSEVLLHGRLHAAMAGRSLRLVDLRDRELSRLQIERSAIASSSAEHYPCTRRLAKLVHAATLDGVPADGIVWHSRQAELTGRPAHEVAVVFTDRVRTGRRAWRITQARTASGALLEGYGRRQFDEIAELLRVAISADLEA